MPLILKILICELIYWIKLNFMERPNPNPTLIGIRKT